MDDGTLFFADHVLPVRLAALSPAEMPEGCGKASEYAQNRATACLDDSVSSLADSAPTGTEDAVRRILDACAEAYARQFAVVRACIRRERVRQQLFREEQNLPKSARVPYERQPLTAAEQTIVDAADAILRALFGPIPADYALDKLHRALNTGDMRAFKIRLLVIKVRDTLANEHSPLHTLFTEGLEKCIEQAEQKAGCKPDPSPRRMSREEQRRKRDREEHEEKIRQQQPELQLQWEDEKNLPEPNQDIDTKTGCSEPVKMVVEQSEKPTKTPKFNILKRSGNRKKQYRNKNQEKQQLSNNIENAKSVTVTKPSVTVTFISKRNDQKTVRTFREYDTVEQILEDIELGRIVPYESADEICKDLKDGTLTETEALLFTMALDRYMPACEEDVPVDSDTAMEMERERVEEEEDNDPSEETEEDEAETFAEDRHSERGTSFSYNPRGFGGCGDDFDDDN